MKDKVNEERDKQLQRQEREKEMERQKEIEKNSLLPKNLPQGLPPPIQNRDPILGNRLPPAKKQKLNDGNAKNTK